MACSGSRIAPRRDMQKRALQVVLAVSVLCAHSPAGDAQDIAWRGVIELASGRAERGAWQQNESRYDYVDDPTVAIDADGEISVAWVEQKRKDIFFQRLRADGAGRLRHAVNVSRNPKTFSWLPRIELAREAPEKIYMLWQEIIFSGGSHGGDILFARSEDEGRTFTAPLNLSRSIGGDGKGRINARIWHNGSLDLAVGEGGTLIAAWTEYHGALWLARSSDGGRSFSRPVRIAGGRGEPARAPSIVFGSSDAVLFLAWSVGEDAGGDVHLARSEDGGASFATPRIIHRTDGYSDAPKLAVGPDRVLHLVHAESDAGPFGRYHIRYARSRNDGLSFEQPQRLGREATSSATASTAFPSIDVDAQGNVHVLWERYPRHGGRPRGLGFAVSHDGGTTFTTAGEVPGSADPAGGSNGSHQGLLMQKLAVNRHGAVAIVNSSLKEGERSRVWLVRGTIQ
jgi:hypothetical protein